MKENNDYFIIEVIAEDFKTYKTYRVKVEYRQPGKNANLSSLVISDDNGEVLKEEFSKDVYLYSGMTYYDSVKVRVVTEDRMAKITVNGIEVDKEELGSTVLLNNEEEVNVIAIRVIAEDGESEKLYLVNIEKKDFDVNLNGDMLVQKYGNGVESFKNYNINRIVYNDSVFIVYETRNVVTGGYVICGRFVDIKTGHNSGKDFLISTSNKGSKDIYKIVQLGERAFIIWTDRINDTIVISGRMINLRTKTFLGNEFLISTTNSDVEDCDIKKIIQSGERVFVIWESKYKESDWDIYGRIIDFTSGPVANNDILISTTNAGDQNIDNINHIVQSGDNVLISWLCRNGGEEVSIRARLIKMINESFAGNDFLASTPNSKSLKYEEIVVSGNRAFLVWSIENSKSGYDSFFKKDFVFRDFRGRIIDLETGQFVPNNDFLISETGRSNDYLNNRVVVVGDYALVMWCSSSNLSYSGTGLELDTISGVRIINLKTGQFINDDNFSEKIVGTSVVKIIQSGDYVLFLSKLKNYNDSGFLQEDLRGHLVNLRNRKVVKSDFSISTTHSEYQTSHAYLDLKSYMDVVQSGKNVLVVWNLLESEEGSRSIYGRIIDMSEGTVGDQDFKINTTINATKRYAANDLYQLQFVQSSEKALVVWNSLDSEDDIEENQNIYGRMIDMTKGPIDNKDFKINTTIDKKKKENLKIIQSENFAFVTWEYKQADNSWDIYGRMIDFETGEFKTDKDFTFNTTTTVIPPGRSIVQSEDSIFMVWHSKENGNEYKLRGRMMDIETGIFITENDFLINSKYYNNQIQKTQPLLQ